MNLFQEMAILDETVQEKKKGQEWLENGIVGKMAKQRCRSLKGKREGAPFVFTAGWSPGVWVCQCVSVCVCVCLRNLVAWVCGGVCVSRCVRCVTAPRSTACEYSPRGFEIMNQ